MPRCRIGVSSDGRLATDCATNLRYSVIRPVYARELADVISAFNLDTDFDDMAWSLMMGHITWLIFGSISISDIPDNTDVISLSDKIWCQGSVDEDLPQSSPIERIGITYAVFPCSPSVVPALVAYTERWSSELANLALYARTLGVPLIRLIPDADRPTIPLELSDIRRAIHDFWRTIATIARNTKHYAEQSTEEQSEDDYYL